MEKIKEILIERGYPEKQATTVAIDLLDIDKQLQGLLHDWLENEKETDCQVAGFKLSELKHKFDMTYPAALLTMDWLIKEPELAAKSINQGIK
ncbi:hypothetical protein [Parabacteroides sp.]